MEPPGNWVRAHPIAVAAILLAGVAIGCAKGTPRAPVSPRAAPAAQEALVVQLAFGEEADLDLFVTGPLEETVYFGNTPALSGGALAEDVRCDGIPPRVERVTYASPRPGRYRIGVDYPRRCSGAEAPIPFVIVVHGPGLHRETRGEVALGRFLPVVLEFELQAPE